MIDTTRSFPQRFHVVYSNSSRASSKKRQAQVDGKLIVTKNASMVSNTNTGYTLVLYDEFDKWICKELVHDMKVYCSRGEIVMKSFEIQIDSLIESDAAETAATGKENHTEVAMIPVQKKFTGFVPPTLVRAQGNPLQRQPAASAASPNPPLKPVYTGASSSNPLFKQINSAGSLASSSSSSSDGDIDSFLTRVMRPHQLEGVRFLLRVMCGAVTEDMRELAICGGSSAAESAADKKSFLRSPRYGDDSDSDDFLESTSPPETKSQPVLSSGAKRYTGAILGDEMGLGKTLQVIAALWMLLKRGRTNKAVIVAPSSLVENWQNEISKWLGVRMEPLVVKAGGSAGDNDMKLKAFVSGDTSKTRLLLISYDNLRKYSSKLNACKGWDVVVCDEGHRLKNSDGNQTIDALMACRASQRIVLTGTPIQNDLDELFAIVSFACPGYFGSLSSFRNGISRHIMDAGGGPASVEASRALKALLSHVMIRRTQEEVLKKLLPPRTDYVIFCTLAASQEAQYAAAAKSVLGFVHQSPVVPQPAGCTADDQEEDTYEQDGAAAMPEEAAEDDGPCGHATLTGLQKLRRICIAAVEETAPAGGRKSSLSVHGNKQTLAAAAAAAAVVVANLEGGVVAELYRRSSKYQLLDTMLGTLRSQHPEEKAVVVASFTSTLDDIAALCDARGYGYLRIDGGVNTANRQGLVDCFNRQSDPRLLFLLGKRSGGQGLNLIGGSRLFMMEPDWNPSVDLQAMSRIWRENQKRLCFVYRFVAAGKIEESIIARQLGKVTS